MIMFLSRKRGAIIMQEIMTVQEFSEATKLKPYVIRRMIKEGRLVFFKSGRRAYINYPESIKIMWKFPEKQ